MNQPVPALHDPPLQSAAMGELSPAGWYLDPDGSGGQRYFDGANWTEHRHAPQQLSPEQRAAKLDEFLMTEMRRNPTMRLESRAPTQAVVVTGTNPNHVVHALFTLFSCGFWAIIWGIAAATQKQRRTLMAVDPYGNVSWA